MNAIAILQFSPVPAYFCCGQVKSPICKLQSISALKKTHIRVIYNTICRQVESQLYDAQEDSHSYVSLTLTRLGFQNHYSVWGGEGQMAHRRKENIQAIFLQSKQQKKTYQGILRTQEPTPLGSQTSLGPSSKFAKILEPLSGFVHSVHIIQSMVPLTMLEHFLGY